MKVLFFTAGSIPTQPELDAIAAIQASVVHLEVGVRHGSSGGMVEATDYKAGNAIPTEYAAKPAWSVDSVPVPAGYASVKDQQELVVPVTGTYATKAKVTVVNGTITAILLS